MTSKNITIAFVTLYTVILVVMYVIYSNQQYTGSDVAGNGLEKALAFYGGLGIMFLIAVVFTIINAFFLRASPVIGLGFFSSFLYHYPY